MASSSVATSLLEEAMDEFIVNYADLSSPHKAGF